jgi:hypothetical protein
VDFRLAEELVLEVIGELAVAGEVDVALGVERIELQIVVLEEHAEGHHAQLFELLLRVTLPVIAGTRGNHVDGTGPSRYAEVTGRKGNHGSVLPR